MLFRSSTGTLEESDEEYDSSDIENDLNDLRLQDEEDSENKIKISRKILPPRSRKNPTESDSSDDEADNNISGMKLRSGKRVYFKDK